MTWSTLLLQNKEIIGDVEWMRSVVHVFPTDRSDDHFIGGHDQFEGRGISQCWCRPIMEALTRGPLGVVGFMYTHEPEEP